MPSADAWLLERLAADAGAGLPEIEPVDEGMMLIPHLDYVAQLTAIRDLLSLHESTEQSAAERIRRLEREAGVLSGVATQQAVDEWLDRLHGTVYQDAAHSMAAVGTLAPLAESVFEHGLLSLGRMHSDWRLPPPGHPRFSNSWPAAWNPKVNGKKGVVAGIREICDGAGITPYLHHDTFQILSALFAYRNAMFHIGLEWPEAKRTAFHERAEAWPGWFVWSTHGDEPWLAYMTSALIDRVITTLDSAIEGLGRYAIDLRKRSSHGT
jgi:hypothetical protein